MSTGRGTDTRAIVASAGALVLLVVAAMTDGGVEPRYGGTVLVGAALLAAWTSTFDVLTARPLARRAILTLAALALVQALPWPHALRAILSPGLADRLAALEGAPTDAEAWANALTALELDAAIDAGATWSFDVLGGAGSPAITLGAVDARGFTWTLALLGGGLLLYTVGRALGAREASTRTFAVGLLLFALAEAIFGIANRDGGRTGLAVKAAYLGSATGTFVHRGQFGALLVLGLGAGWGLAGALFPLLPEEVRRHMQRKRRSSQPPGVLEASGDRIPRLAVLGLVGAILATALVASRARGPILALGLVGVLAGVWVARRRDERWHLGIAVTMPLAGLALASLAWGPRGALGRFLGTLSGDDVSASARVALWRESLQAFAEAPLVGHGLGAWNAAWGPHQRAPHLYAYLHAHGEPFEILVEGGILGAGAVLALAWAWVRAWREGLDTAPQELRTSVAVGLGVAVMSVAVYALADFPLRAPGVLVPWSLCAGVAHGALLPAEGAASSAERVPRQAVWALGALVAVLGGQAAWADASSSAPRAQRVGEVHPVWRDGDDVRTVAEVEAFLDAATSATRASPLDPWTHMAVARAYAQRGELTAKQGGGAPTVEFLEADRSLARARRLRPRDPRLEVAIARIELRIAAYDALPGAWRARALGSLTAAVRLDAWRAEEAFTLARDFASEELARIGAAADDADPRSRARVLHQLGKALERRKDATGALAAQEAAVAADPGLGPAHFARGVLLRAAGDEAAAQAAFATMVTSRERPKGMEGWAYAFQGKLDEARQRFAEVLANDPRNRWSLEGLAEVARQRGDAPAEIDAWRRVRQLAPDDVNVQKRLAEAEARRDARR